MEKSGENMLWKCLRMKAFGQSRATSKQQFYIF